MRGEREQFVWAGRVLGVPRLIFQQVDDASSRSGKVHLDLSTNDLESDTARAVALGATVVGDVAELGINWRVLRDPEANSFCLIPK